MSETATATFDFAPEDDPTPQVRLTAEDVEEIRANYRLVRWHSHHWRPHFDRIHLANCEDHTRHRDPLAQRFNNFVTVWGSNEGVDYKVGRTSRRSFNHKAGEIPAEIDVAASRNDLTVSTRANRLLRDVAIVQRELCKSESDCDADLLRTLYGLGFLNKPRHQTISDSHYMEADTTNLGEIHSIKAKGCGKLDTSGAGNHRPAPSHSYKKNFEGTGFYIEDLPQLDHAELQNHVTQLRLNVYTGSREDAEASVNEIDAIVFDAAQSGTSIEEWAKENDRDPDNLRRAISRRMKMIGSKIEHVCPDGTCLSNNCAKGGDVDEHFTHWVNGHPEVADEMFIQGGYYLFYKLAGVHRLVHLSAQCDEEADVAVTQIYERSHRDAQRKAQAEDKDSAAERVLTAFQTAQINYLDPNPTYVPGVVGGQDGYEWTPTVSPLTPPR